MLIVSRCLAVSAGLTSVAQWVGLRAGLGLLDSKDRQKGR